MSNVIGAMTVDGWQWGPGDPSLMGYFTTLLYLIVSVICWSSATRVANTPKKVSGTFYGSGPERASHKRFLTPFSVPGPARREYLFWMLLAGCLFLLAVNKQGDLQSAITYFGRGIAKSQGWYEERRQVQLYFLISVTVCFIVAGLALLRFVRGIWGACWLAILGLTVQMIFIIIRATSMHHVDAFLGFRLWGANMNVLLECSGIICIAVGALRTGKDR